MILPGMFTIIVRPWFGLWFNVLFNVLHPKYPIYQVIYIFRDSEPQLVSVVMSSRYSSTGREYLPDTRTLHQKGIH